MTQSTTFAQVATNLLNVLQGYTKGIRFVAVLTMLLIVGIGQAWSAEGDEAYTLSCIKNTSNSAYANYYDVTINSKKWSAPGNQTLGAYWRIGGGKGTSVSRDITGKSTIDKPIKKITVSHNGRSNSNLTVNSFSVTVARDANFSNIVETKTISSPSVSNAGSFDLSPTNSVWETGCYYKFTIVYTHTQSKNYGLDLTSIVFYEGSTTPSCTNPTISTQPTGETYTKGDSPTALSVVASGDDLTYQWYSNTSNSTSGATKINGATNSTYTPSTATADTKYYYCIVSSGTCSTTSDIVSVVVNNPTYTVTWDVNGTTQSLSPYSVTDGNNLGTLPTPNLDGICEGKTFVGWTTEANKNYSHETTAPLLITEDTKPNGDVTYYAVFATPEDGAKKTIIFANEWNDTQDLSEHSYFDNAITLSFAKNEGTTAPKYYTSSAAIRLYYGNTMTVTTTAPMQSITFTFVTEDANGNSISTYPDFGTLSKTPTNQLTESLTHTWNVNTTSVTFTIGKDQTGSESGHCKISQIDIITGGGAASYSDYTTSCGQTYTITLNTNGGTINAGNVTSYTYGVGATLPTNVTKENHQFGGWFDNSGCTGTAVTAISTTATGNKEYWAKWTEFPKYTVTWSADGHPIKTQEVYVNEQVSEVPTSSDIPEENRCGDKFFGWTTDPIQTPQDDAPTVFTTVDGSPTITKATTFYAVFADYAD